MFPRQRPRHTDRRRAHLAPVDQHLHAPVGRPLKRTREGRVQVVAGAEGVAVGALDHEQRHGPVAGADHGLQLAQVLRRPGRDAVGELGQRRGARQVAVLDLQPAALAGSLLQQEVDAASLAVLHLAPVEVVAAQFGNGAGGQGLGDEAVGQHGVHAGQTAVGRLDHLQRMGQLALWIVRLRQPDAQPRRVDAQHGAGIWAVGGDLLAGVERNIGEEPLVAADQDAVAERGGELHAPDLPSPLILAKAGTRAFLS